MTSSLDARYRSTIYRVFIAGDAPIDLRIGEPSARLDLVLESHGAEAWAFISAWNPASRELPPAQNGARHAELLAIIRERGWSCLDGSGIPAHSDWTAEASVLVPGIALDEAVALGRRFGQNAIVAGRRGGAAELVYCT
jgi:hypothetical protein